MLHPKVSVPTRPDPRRSDLTVPEEDSTMFVCITSFITSIKLIEIKPDKDAKLVFYLSLIQGILTTSLIGANLHSIIWDTITILYATVMILLPTVGISSSTTTIQHTACKRSDNFQLANVMRSCLQTMNLYCTC